MRAEIDLPNRNGKLTSGMYGAVTLSTPPPTDAVIVPKDCLIGRSTNGRGQVMVVMDGRCQLRTVGLGHYDGEQVEILWNLASHELVVLSKSGAGDLEAEEGAMIDIVATHQMSPTVSYDFDRKPVLQASR